ncbi:protein SPEC3-like [Saccoglossus kowalevskii]
MPMAIFCCVVNFVLPGIGTIVASFSVLTCCARHESLPARIGIFILNAVCGVLQLGLSPFLIGWVWSIVWGCAFIGMATEYVPPTSTLQEPVSHQVVPPPPSYNPQQNVPFYPQDPPPPYYGATHGLSLEVHSQDTESEEVLESSVPPVDMT